MDNRFYIYNTTTSFLPRTLENLIFNMTSRTSAPPWQFQTKLIFKTGTNQSVYIKKPKEIPISVGTLSNVGEKIQTTSVIGETAVISLEMNKYWQNFNNEIENNGYAFVHIYTLINNKKHYIAENGTWSLLSRNKVWCFQKDNGNSNVLAGQYLIKQGSNFFASSGKFISGSISNPDNNIKWSWFPEERKLTSYLQPENYTSLVALRIEGNELKIDNILCDAFDANCRTPKNLSSVHKNIILRKNAVVSAITLECVNLATGKMISQYDNASVIELIELNKDARNRKFSGATRELFNEYCSRENIYGHPNLNIDDNCLNRVGEFMMSSDGRARLALIGRQFCQNNPKHPACFCEEAPKKSWFSKIIKGKYKTDGTKDIASMDNLSHICWFGPCRTGYTQENKPLLSLDLMEKEKTCPKNIVICDVNVDLTATEASTIQTGDIKIEQNCELKVTEVADKTDKTDNDKTDTKIETKTGTEKEPEKPIEVETTDKDNNCEEIIERGECINNKRRILIKKVGSGCIGERERVISTDCISDEKDDSDSSDNQMSTKYIIGISVIVIFVILLLFFLYKIFRRNNDENEE